MTRSRFRKSVVACATSVVAASMLLSASGAEGSSTLYTAGVFGPLAGALDISPQSGALTPVPGSPFGGPDVSDAPALTPDGRYALFTSAGTSRVLPFRTGAGGTLSPLPPITFTGPPDPDPSGIAISPSGKFAYVADSGPEAVRELQIGDDGSLTQVGTAVMPGADLASGVAITPDGRFVYVTSQNPPGRVWGFRVLADGTLDPLPSSPTASGGVSSVTITPDGRFLYAAVASVGGIWGYSIGPDGELAAVPGSPYATAVESIAANPAGGELFGAFTGPTGGVAAILVNANGSLTNIPGSFISPGHATDAIAVSHTGSHVYAGGGTAPGSKLSGYAVAPSGALTLIPGSPFDPQAELPTPEGYAISPNQPPTAAAVTRRGSARNEVVFDGTPTVDVDGTVAGRVWDFGDGSAPVEGTTVNHTYTDDRVYTATLTATDDEGCSTAQVFTGQTAACNGGPPARTRIEVDLVPPSLSLSAKKKQRLRRSIAVTATCVDACTLSGKGSIEVMPTGKGRAKSLTVKGFEQTLQSSVAAKIALKLPASTRKKGKQALRAGSKLRVMLEFTPSEELTSASPVKQSVRIKR